jgi:hypothetical protein
MMSGAVWGSSEEEETWTALGRVAQKDDLWVGGGEAVAEIGYALGGESGTRLVPTGGIGFLFQRFERSGFRLFGSEETSIEETVQEDFEVAFVRAGAELQQALTERLQLYAQGNYGYVFYYNADNSAFGELDGEGGNILEGRLGLRWQVSTDTTLSAGIRYYNQDLDGDSEERTFIAEDGSSFPGIIELPDNELTRVGGEVTWQITF